MIRDHLPADAFAAADEYLQHAGRSLVRPSPELATFIDPGQPNSALLDRYVRARSTPIAKPPGRFVLDAVNSGVPVRDIYLQVFQPAQYEIGRLWQTNRISVAQEHYCTAATQLIMSQLYPLIFSSPRNGLRMVAACVQGDSHELGLRMVSDFFELEGWDTLFLGASTPAGSTSTSSAGRDRICWRSPRP